MDRITVDDIKAMKGRGEKVVMLTAYDYPSARLAEEAGVDMILVGDTLGMVVLGYDSTLPVTMEDMIHHTKAAARGSQRALVVADMPFMSFQISTEDAMRNAGRLMKETGCQAVKLEGGVHMAETVRRLVQIGIPVVGHIGLTPQSVNQLSGFKVQGRTPEAAERLMDDAVALQQAGAFCLVLETNPIAAGKADQRAPASADDRHRRRRRLRRPGPGLARPALAVLGVHAEAREAVRPDRRGDKGGRWPVCRRGPLGPVPDPERELPHGREGAAGACPQPWLDGPLHDSTTR